MSTEYCLLKKVHACDLFDGRLLEKFNVREHVVPNETTKKSRCLTDGRNSLWVYIDDDGIVSVIARYGGNAPGKILNAIAEAFDTDIVSEYEPQYLGFDTQEEWDAWEEKMARESEKKFHSQLLKYLRGEPNDIRPGTIGMIEAEIAKALVEGDPSLILPENADKLRSRIKTIYRRDHAVIIKLDDQQMDFAKMLATHEDDLPSA
jgi:hypothetical protein